MGGGTQTESRTESFPNRFRQMDWRRHTLEWEAIVEKISGMTETQKELIASFEDYMPPLRRWPHWASQLFVSNHLRFSERLSLTKFLLLNHVPPIAIAEWYIESKSLKDKSARDHVADIIKAHKEGRLANSTSWLLDKTDAAGNDVKDKTTKLVAPSFVEDHEYYWDDAVRMLKARCGVRILDPVAVMHRVKTIEGALTVQD